MKQSHNLDKVELNMAQGVISGVGFLGHDTRHLTDIIAADEQEMAACGLDWERTAIILREMLTQAQKGLGEDISFGENLVLRSSETRGTLPCPWEDGIFHKVDCLVQDREGHDLLIFNELGIHLLETHHFLQGIGSRFRIDPDRLARIPGMKL